MTAPVLVALFLLGTSLPVAIAFVVVGRVKDEQLDTFRALFSTLCTAVLILPVLVLVEVAAVMYLWPRAPLAAGSISAGLLCVAAYAVHRQLRSAVAAR